MNAPLPVSIDEMSRRLRYIPPDSLVEITCRTIQGRYLLKPSPRLRELVNGVLGRAKRLYPVEIHAFVFLSNHYHLLVTVPDADRLARFMNYVQSNLAREVGRLQDWSGTLWSKRYQAIPVTAEEEAQVARLRYLLSHGCKEGLVHRPQDWPGAQCIRELLAGGPVRGVWVDRTAAYELKVQGKPVRRTEVESEEGFLLDPLPCWKGLDPEEARARVGALIRSITEETARAHARAGTQPAGSRAFRKVHPHQRPSHLKRGPAPRVHAWRKDVRARYLDAYRAFIEAFRDAVASLTKAAGAAPFPEGSFPPGQAFVPHTKPG